MLGRECGLSIGPPGGRQVARVPEMIERGWLRQRGARFHWIPVFLGCGIGTYFALPQEPPVAVTGACSAAAVGILTLALWRWGEWSGPLGCALAVFLGGVAIAGLRTHAVAEPVLDFRYYGPIEGRIVAIDRSASDALRITLDRVALSRVDPAKVPRRVRLSLHGAHGVEDVQPGLRVMTTGHLAPPAGPVEP